MSGRDPASADYDAARADHDAAPGGLDPTPADVGAAAGRRVLTPAVTAAAAFAVFAAIASVTFVSARGGLQLPVAPTSSPTTAEAGATPVPRPPATATANPTATATASATATGPSPEPTTEATPAPSAVPTLAPSAAPTPLGTPDPLAALPGCPSHPGCYEYAVRRGDSYTAINDRFGLLLWMTNALNPEVTDKGLIVVGQTLYLGRDPEARLDLCPDGAPCRLYTVRSGDTLGTIADRYGISEAGIEALNPSVNPNAVGPGLVIRLPLYQG